MSAETPLDEIQWRSPIAGQMQGVRSNTVLFYFAESPFFDRTSNNAVLTAQAMFNASMFRLLETREAFEARLRTMSGLEFVVAQEPPPPGPGIPDSGVWVIRRQTRRKGVVGAGSGADDEDGDGVILHSAYFVVGENIYMAPTLADIFAARIEHMTAGIAKSLLAADSVKEWSPALGHTYKLPSGANPNNHGRTKPIAEEAAAESLEIPSSSGGSRRRNGSSSRSETVSSSQVEVDRLAEESFQIHMRYGGDFLNENPITGRPGDFHMSSTGRRERAAPPPPLLPLLSTDLGGISALGGGDQTVGEETKKEAKTPRTPTMLKPKRRKSKIVVTTVPPA